MAVKTLQTRIQLKKDTEANWLQSNLIPFNGEVIIYSPDESHAAPRIKVGDGVTVVSNLPFVEASGSIDLNNIVAKRVEHKLTFGDGTYQFDGSVDVNVPVYTGDYSHTTNGDDSVDDDF